MFINFLYRLIEIVERRNEIVECLEMDRRREVEEDKSINMHMGLFVGKQRSILLIFNVTYARASVERNHYFSARNKNELSGKDNDGSDTARVKKGKAKEKLKEKKSKKAAKKDADKDVDETEVKQKRHKRKWF